MTEEGCVYQLLKHQQNNRKTEWKYHSPMVIIGDYERNEMKWEGKRGSTLRHRLQQNANGTNEILQ
jgi:hypothetical protein